MSGPPYDQVEGTFPSVDLHLTDVRTGSFSVAQVELRAQQGGWLLAMAVASLVNTSLLGAVAWYLWNDAQSNSATSPDISLLLVFVSFASTVIAQQDPHPMLSRLLRLARVLAGISTLCTLFAASRVALNPSHPRSYWIIVPAVVSFIPAALLTFAAWRSRRGAQQPAPGLSPWDFTGVVEDVTPGRRPGESSRSQRPKTFAEAKHVLAFDQVATVVDSSESVRTHATWDRRLERRVDERLTGAIEQLDNL